jgi:hypothetical protein
MVYNCTAVEGKKEKEEGEESGTTLRVASKLGRKGIGIEINKEYLEIARKRCKLENESLASYL